MQSLTVADPSQVAAARRIAATVARAVGFGEVDQGRVALVATELAGNLVRHGRGGQLLVGSQAPDGPGEAPVVELLALDRGPGMTDIAACLRDGFSTAGTPGTGLGAIIRQSENFDIHSAPGSGTAILARLRRGRAALPPAAVSCAAVNLPKPGEEVSGDAWAFELGAETAALFVADGLGHGPLAAEASREAIRLFRRAPLAAPTEVLRSVHGGLRPTRGAAVAIARLDLAARVVAYGGIGNIAGTIVAADGVRRMVSLNGTAGHTARSIQEFRYPVLGLSLIVLCSDGLGTSWSLDRYPGLASRDPLLIAGVLCRDFARGTDDLTVAVLRAAAP
ncbi:ATP-binding protein [Belnapia sp. T6]|uniref:ATP-binding protein n=1 Tax=Belnapia mucosa TaxID=2804532 RepID=A0ABS1V331_9PROT|nr:ATP-binding SpoIIE family protein phosphatase [Belnapia mucosa]MBL6456108.1 ATP-binding protein [Belnapia mucosa]